MGYVGYVGSTLGYFGSALACIAFAIIFVNIRTTFGYFGSTLGYVGSILEYTGSFLGQSRVLKGMFGIFWHTKYLYTNYVCLEKVKMAIRTQTSEWVK